MEYKRFTDEERQKAKNTDMIAFLESYMSFEFKKVGKYYQCRQHDSLMIYPDRQGFSWNSRNISGSDAIDFLRNIEGKSFREAMEIILYGSFYAEIQPVIVKPPNNQLILPEPAAQCNRLFDYLCKRRKISADVVNDFINQYNASTTSPITDISKGNIRTKFFGYSYGYYLELLNSNATNKISVTINETNDNADSGVPGMRDVFHDIAKTIDPTLSDEDIYTYFDDLVSGDYMKENDPFGTMLILYVPDKDLSSGHSRGHMVIDAQ